MRIVAISDPILYHSSIVISDEEWDSAETVEILSLNRLIDLIESKKLPNVNATNLVLDHKFSEIEKILGL